ncbi:MAG: cobalt-precorrin-5B (C(1))-methyltransferase CbiD [Deltaproteobacteria bacterium]|nr:cobalt-precorrin-5B (C(1))-methyltransferase CbiD [Deltaproteobacteria bacterium]
MEPQKPKTLRTGFSTGTAATAAAIGAAKFLLEGKPPDAVKVSLPKEKELTIKIADASREDSKATAIVVKDAGDDPDVTNKARVGATLEFIKTPGLTIQGGQGVGRLTKPGLVLPPGEWAINPVPRKMLNNNLAPFLTPAGPGLKVTVFIEKGEALAKYTLNPRLGIIGGLSVLGTTGLVRPFSHKAYIATIDSAMAVAKAQGLTEIVLTTGGRSEGFGRVARPDLPVESFIQIADFYGDALKLATKYGFKNIGLAVFFGKAVKQAQGIFNTHAHKSELTLGPVVEWFPHLSRDLKNLLSSAPTALAALEILRAHGALEYVQIVAQKVVSSTRNLTGPDPYLWVRIFDFDGTTLAFCEG